MISPPVYDKLYGNWWERYVLNNSILNIHFKLDSGCGITFLVNKDYRQLQKDLNYLRHVEKYAISLILTEEWDTEKNYVSNTE